MLQQAIEKINARAAKVASCRGQHKPPQILQLYRSDREKYFRAYGNRKGIISHIRDGTIDITCGRCRESFVWHIAIWRHCNETFHMELGRAATYIMDVDVPMGDMKEALGRPGGGGGRKKKRKRAGKHVRDFQKRMNGGEEEEEDEAVEALFVGGGNEEEDEEERRVIRGQLYGANADLPNRRRQIVSSESEEEEENDEEEDGEQQPQAGQEENGENGENDGEQQPQAGQEENGENGENDGGQQPQANGGEEEEGGELIEEGPLCIVEEDATMDSLNGGAAAAVLNGDAVVNGPILRRRQGPVAASVFFAKKKGKAAELKALTDEKPKKRKNWPNIPKWMETRGQKKSGGGSSSSLEPTTSLSTEPSTSAEPTISQSARMAESTLI